MSKNEEKVKNSVFGFDDSNKAFAKIFKGTSYLKALEEGKAAQKMLLGDVVIVNPNTKYWHEATKDS
ncbi:hypothetical protein [Lactobacillus taiwanensis]|uniref:hypothetical protein n=1 Tax=Lactobacillus taiwanensis TaxID=508451 RepID=UPI00353023F1